MTPRDTARIRFTPVTMEDATLLHALNYAPGVMTYLDRRQPSLDDVRTDVASYITLAEDVPGYGLWLGFEKVNNACIGRFGLRPNSPHPGDAEVGYRLFPRFWGQGLASEASREILRYAFEELAAHRFVAITMAVNERSRRVMERTGLHYVRTFFPVFDDPLTGTELGEVEYAITREEWVSGRS